ncbi:MAG: hypothetical protein OJF51_002373 [Nitrospira sp.]|nr:MAG: hypothetical protein OJF51_002373 [Nitrospira sp.]
MLPTPIGTHKNADSRLCESSVVVGVNILYAFINKVQVDLMTGIKSRACKTVNSLGTVV